MKEIGTGWAISPSGKRTKIAFLQVGEHVKTYRLTDTQYANWEITVGWNFNSVAHAIEIIESKGWMVEKDQ